MKGEINISLGITSFLRRRKLCFIQLVSCCLFTYCFDLMCFLSANIKCDISNKKEMPHWPKLWLFLDDKILEFLSDRLSVGWWFFRWKQQYVASDLCYANVSAPDSSGDANFSNVHLNRLESNSGIDDTCELVETCVRQG